MSVRSVPQQNRAASHDTAEAIEQAALRAFYRRGYYGSSIREIARGADIGVATLFHHFPSKAAILDRILYRAVDELQNELDAVLEGVADPVARFADAVRVLVTSHCEKQMQSAVGRTELRSLEPPACDEVRLRRVRIQRLFEQLLEDGKASGDFHCEHPKLVAQFVVCAGVMVSAWYRPDGELTPDQIGDIYVSMALLLAASEG